MGVGRARGHDPEFSVEASSQMRRAKAMRREHLYGADASVRRSSFVNDRSPSGAKLGVQRPDVPDLGASLGDEQPAGQLVGHLTQHTRAR